MVFSAVFVAALAAFAAPATVPNSTTYCCGLAGKPACSGPDWTVLAFAFSPDATAVAVNITIDGAASGCKAEVVKVVGKAVTFPGIANKTDCLGLLVTNTGALSSDLALTYNPVANTLEVEVDSEGVDELLQMC